MSAETKILIVEHDKTDIELLEFELKKGGIRFISEVVQNEEEFSSAITNFVPDIILSDFALPSFDGPTAFNIRQTLAPEIPFIFVSGNIGEENSIEYIKNGVTDYAQKEKLFTLTTKVERALKESKEEQQKYKIGQERIKSERRLSMAQQIAHMGSWELDLSTNILLWSDEMCRIFGLSPQQNKQSLKHWLSFVHPVDRDLVSRNIKECRDKLRNFSFYHRIVLKNGVTRHIYSESKIEFNPDGVPTMLYGIAQDVTEIELAKEQLEFDRNNLKALINNTKDLMWSIDRNFNLITSNERFDELVKNLSGRVIAMGSSIFSAGFSSQELTRFRNFYERSFAGESFMEVQHTDAAVESWSEIYFCPIRKGNEIIGTACFARDITASIRAEQHRNSITDDLVQRNKDLEQFTYIISHNLRAPVANILGASTALKSPGLGNHEREILSRGVSESVIKLDDVVNDLNNILQVKMDINERKDTVRFSKLVEEVKLSIQNVVATSDVQIHCDFTEVDEFVTLKSYLHSIFYNLISNGIKYRRAEVESYIRITSQIDKNSLQLVFSDNGLGIDLKKRGDQVFGLYKRFHTDIEGKGMGLYMVKTQVETLSGKISIKSAVNEGTEFRIRLPK